MSSSQNASTRQNSQPTNRDAQIASRWPSPQTTVFVYKLANFYHPLAGRLIGQLNQHGLTGLFNPDYQRGLAGSAFDTSDGLKTRPSKFVEFDDLPHEEIDVKLGGAYATYNWELFFHIPLTIAVYLSKNRRYAEAQRWFHYIFDPTCNEARGQSSRQWWKFMGFRYPEELSIPRIDDLLALLEKPSDACTSSELDLKAAIVRAYETIQKKPFQPHVVARSRTVAYQYSVVMKYLDNLIAWGDDLFAQDTTESINEATQCYVLAANLLGPRPQHIPPRGTAQGMTFAKLQALAKADKDAVDPMGNALVELEGRIPFDFALPETRSTLGSAAKGPLLGIGRTLYFCIPPNEKLLAYWDTVADRLFKLRHCMDIQGVVRQLPLFDPSIDPAMLVKAAAAGLDVGSIVSGLNRPIGPVRSLPLIQKALELAAEVRALGNALLAALEKGDAEHLASLRQRHEVAIQQAAEDVRFLQWKQSEAVTEALLRTRASVLERYRYYQRLLGKVPDSDATPETLLADRRNLNADNFDDAYSALVGKYDKTMRAEEYPPLKLATEAPATASGAAGVGRLYLNSNEDAELNVHLPLARNSRAAASAADALAAPLTFIPDLTVNGEYWGIGMSSVVFGGNKMAEAAKTGAEVLRTISAWEQDQAGIATRTASYQRRADEWILQNNLAARELVQMGRQILSSLIAEQVARHEYVNVQKQVAQSKEVETFLGDKFTNEELYGWMQGELSQHYYQFYRFAFEAAGKAERTMKRELMRPEVDAVDYVRFNYWDSGRRGLLSGEALYLDVKRMEMAYHDANKREFEMTRHVSLRQLNPLALLALKATGRCEVEVPEWLFDRDCPGHYMRRLKTVAISVPAVVGPYATVNCTLSLLRSTIRTSPALKGGSYKRGDGEDGRFVDYPGLVQSVVTSSGSNDGGLFETNLRDERFLPFEGGGACSTWRLELPTEFPSFDHATISDVVLHLRYTARQGGAELGRVASKELREQESTMNQYGLALLFSLRYDFPTEWAAFVNGGELSIRLRREHFPYAVQGAELTFEDGAVALYSPSSGMPQATRQTGLDNLKHPGGYCDLVFSVDAGADSGRAALRRDAAQVFMIIRYSASSAGRA
jgi:hypothetical protein